jgi:predicted alpha/beta superfamily hydrolase
VSFSLDLIEKMYKSTRKNYSDLLIGMSIGGLLLISAVLKSSEVVPFIYFRF